MGKKEELRAKWNNAGKDVVVLHMFQRARTCPNPSPYPIKIEMFLRMNNIEYITDFEQPMSSKGKSPWITINGKDVADSQIAINHLKEELKINPDKDLTPEQLAIARGLRAILEDHMYYIYVYHRMVIHPLKDVPSFFPPLLDGVPKLLRPLVLKKIQSGLRQQVMGQGLGRHSKEDQQKMGMEDLESLSNYLGTKPFMMGDNPTSIDGVVFGFMCMVLFCADDENRVFKEAAESKYRNLVEHTNRLIQRYWSDWEECKWKDDKKEK